MEQVAQLFARDGRPYCPQQAICAKVVAHSLAMLIYRDRGVKVKNRVNVPVSVNPVQITARYSHSSRKTKPNPNTKRNPNPINTRVPVNQTLALHANSIRLAGAVPIACRAALYAARRCCRSAERFPNISTLIPSFRKPRRSNPTSTRHEQHAVPRFTILRLKDRFSVIACNVNIYTVTSRDQKYNSLENHTRLYGSRQSLCTGKSPLSMNGGSELVSWGSLRGLPYLLLQTVFSYDVPFCHNTNRHIQRRRQTTCCNISSTFTKYGRPKTQTSADRRLQQRCVHLVHAESQQHPGQERQQIPQPPV